MQSPYMAAQTSVTAEPLGAVKIDKMYAVM
jgi:hypothetical protein